MQPLADHVARALRVLASPGARVVLALSGGPDSVAMTHLLREAAASGAIELAGIAHFNHRLRGSEADADEAFCRDLASALGLPFVSASADVAAHAREHGQSLENAARQLRYDFLECARVELEADVVAVGHTRDDQAETYLLRLLRGAGPRGLSGIRPRLGTVIRPLLEVSRPELLAWLEERQLPYRVDPSNADIAIARNRVRHDIIPALERGSPGVADALARAARIAADDDDFISSHVAGALTRIVSTEGEPGSRLALEPLRQLHPAIARRVVQDTMQRVAPARFVGLKHVDAVLSLVLTGSGQLDAPGQRAVVEGEWLRLTPSEARPRQLEESNVFRYLLSIPGEALIPESGVTISAEILTGDGRGAETVTDGAVVAAAALDRSAGLAVRNRRPGDRFRPAGFLGRKKLQDYFVDRKVPRAERDKVPLVVDAKDRIVWVVGHTVAQDFRVTDPEGAVLLLKVRRLGGSV
jgi:tRNA(Ile)-lysidine synthase